MPIADGQMIGKDNYALFCLIPSDRGFLGRMLQAGDTITDYIVEAPVGEGGGARVYRVRHNVLHSLHALKVLDPSLRLEDGVRERFLQEGRIAETQVIIIENSHQLPGDGTLSDVNVVLFTGNDQGRRGFIPQAAGVA